MFCVCAIDDEYDNDKSVHTQPPKTCVSFTLISVNGDQCSVLQKCFRPSKVAQTKLKQYYFLSPTLTK